MTARHPRRPGPDGATRQPATRRGRRRARRPARVTLLREIRGDSPVHRLWAGTKLLAVAALSVTLSFFPSWGALGLVAALLAVTAQVARIPAGAWPRPPGWFWAVLAVTGVLTTVSGGSPYLHVGAARLGLGGLEAFARFVAVGIVLLLVAAMVGWTTALGDIAPAVARLGRPLRRLRVPVDEWAVVVALCVRSLPLLTDELRTLVAARRLRPRRPGPAGDALVSAPARGGGDPAAPAGTHPASAGTGEAADAPGWSRWVDEVLDLLVAALAAAMRRAGEMAEAISARGGTGVVVARVEGPSLGDGVALAVVVAVCVGAAFLPGP